MKTKLFNNLWLKLLSVAAAAVLWLVVMNINDAVSSRPFNNIKVNTINMDALTSQGQTVRVDEETDSVNIVVYARQTVLDKLKASDFVATADMQKDLQFGTMVSIEVKYTGDYDIERIEQSRKNVLVSIEEEVTEQFKVTMGYTGQPSNGLVVGSLVPEQTLVEITGPASVVNRVKRVVANVNVAGMTSTQVKTCRLRLENSDGVEIDGTYLQYTGKDTDFDVTVNILNTKLVGISFDISEAAPEGYGISAITYKPETVTIAGQKSDISGIYNLNIPPEALNPDGQTGSVEQTVDISQYLPSGITIPNEDEREVAVNMEVVPHETVNYSFSPEQIQYDNMPENVELDVSESESLELSVSGLESDLAELTVDSIVVRADLSQIRRAGTYTVPVTAELPEKFTCPEGLTLTVRLVRTSTQ